MTTNPWFGWQWLRVAWTLSKQVPGTWTNIRYPSIFQTGADPIPHHTHLQWVWISWELGQGCTCFPPDKLESLSLSLWFSLFDSRHLLLQNTTTSWISWRSLGDKERIPIVLSGAVFLRLPSLEHALSVHETSHGPAKGLQHPPAHPCLMGNWHTSSRKDLGIPNLRLPCWNTCVLRFALMFCMVLCVWEEWLWVDISNCWAHESV